MEKPEIPQNNEKIWITDRRKWLEIKVAEYEKEIKKLEELKEKYPDIAKAPNDGGVAGSEFYNIWQDLCMLGLRKKMLAKWKKELEEKN